MKKQKGQVILVLILIMTVALAIGLSIVQKSLVDVATSTKVEQSSRAFSAAEAGIEKALQGSSCGINCVSFTENSSKADVSNSGLIPGVPDAGASQDPLEYPPLAKEEIAHVWLADPKANLPNCRSEDVCYKQTTLDVYWGNSVTDKAAIELTLVYYNGSQYISRKWYLDQTDRNPTNRFDTTALCGDNKWTVGQNKYQCKKILGDSIGINNGLLQDRLMLIRARLLYNTTTSQPFAVQAVGTCGDDCSIPPQARVINSKGSSGETQRSVRVFQEYKVVPPYFDYAIFSAGAINK